MPRKPARAQQTRNAANRHGARRAHMFSQRSAQQRPIGAMPMNIIEYTPSPARAARPATITWISVFEQAICSIIV